MPGFGREARIAVFPQCDGCGDRVAALNGERTRLKTVGQPIESLQAGRRILTNVGHFAIIDGSMIVNIAEAKALLSQLAARASRGEEIILARHGQPIARIVSLADVVPAAPNRGFGIGRGDFTVPDDFDNPLPDDVLDTFEADNVFPK